MFCPHCGQAVTEGATFCGSCGKALVEGVHAEREGYHAGKEIAGIWIRIGSLIVDVLVVTAISFVATLILGDSVAFNGIGLAYALLTYA